MSIRGEIRRRVVAGDLVKLTPNLRSIAVGRIVILSREVNGLIAGPWVDEETEEVFGRLKADLESFAAGQPVSVAKNPRRAKTAFLSRLEGERGQFWELRQRSPRPGIRVFGGFAAKDLFVALTWSPRGPLQGFGSRDWRANIEKCKTEWRNLFFTWPPMGNAEANADEYLSNILLI